MSEHDGDHNADYVASIDAAELWGILEAMSSLPLHKIDIKVTIPHSYYGDRLIQAIQNLAGDRNDAT